MGWADNISRTMSRWLKIEAAKPDTSDQPDLKDVFVAAPPRLAAPIRQAGGDPDRVVRWFECDAGEVFRFATAGEAAVEGWRSFRGCFESTGCWPVILGANESIERLGYALFEPA